MNIPPLIYFVAFLWPGPRFYSTNISLNSWGVKSSTEVVGGRRGVLLKGLFLKVWKYSPNGYLVGG